MAAINKIPVVILAGGLGTRLGEETIKIPKPMVMIGEKPMIWHIMNIYSHFGLRSFIICLGYKGEIIKKYFYHYAILNSDIKISIGKKNTVSYFNKGDMGDIQVILANTGLNSFTGSRLKKVQKYIKSDNFMVTYGDGVANINIAKLLRFHIQHGKIATVTGIKPPTRFGDLVINGSQVKEFTEKPKTEGGYVNGGYFVFNRAIFEYLSEDEGCILEKEPLEKLARDGQLMVFKHDDFWRCVDTPRELALLNDLWKNDKAQWKVWKYGRYE